MSPLTNMFSNTLKANQLNIFTSEEQLFEISKKMLKCKVKSGSQKYDCLIQKAGNNLTVNFKNDVFAITPGQLCVIYDNEGLIMLSGIIEKNDSKKKLKDKTNA